MKKFYTRFLSVFILIVFGLNANAQNCTVNAGINQNLCPGQSFVLQGTATGSFDPNGLPAWSQISGPAVILGTPVIAGSTINVPISGYSLGNTYVFRLSAKCADGSLIFQNVTFNTLVATIANAGPDIAGCPGTQVLSGSALGVGETGAWTTISGPFMSVSPSNSPTGTVTLPSGTSGVSTLRWTVTNSNGCTSFDNMTVTNAGGVSPVTVPADITLSHCYTTTTSTNYVYASYGGDGTNGQQGQWTFISGPSTPTITLPTNYYTQFTNLIQGTYRFRWTVSGPCVNGFDEIDVIVPAATQSITQSNYTTQTFCAGATSAVLTGTTPGLTGEVGTWTVVNLPGTVTNPNVPITTVTGLSGLPADPSTFRYTIHNATTNCTSIGDHEINFTEQVTITTPQTTIINPCGIQTVNIPITSTGGSQTDFALISAPSGSQIQSNYGLNNYIGYTTAQNTTISLGGFNQIGTYVIRIKRRVNNGVGGCQEAYVDVSILISQSPTLANAGTNQLLLCTATQTNLAGNAPVIGTGSWSQVSGPNTVNIVNPSSPTSQITGLTHGSYVLRWIVTGNNGCPNNQSDVTISVANVVPSPAVTGPDQPNKCYASPISLTASPLALNETGVWTAVPSSGITFTPGNNSINTTANGLAANTTYYFIWTVSNGCGTSKDTTIVTTTAFPGAQQALAGADVCVTSPTTTYTLAGNQPAVGETGLWSFISGPATPTITSPTLYNTGVTGLTTNGQYTFVWSLSKSGCSSTYDTVIITKTSGTPIAIAGPNQTVCGATTITMAANTPGVGTGMWSQIAGPGGAIITNPSLPNTTVTNLSPGNYIFQWAVTNGACSMAFSNMTVNVSTPPSTSNAGTDISICSGTSTTLGATPATTGTGLWSVVAGPSSPTFVNAANPTTVINNLVTGTYLLRWSIANGPYCPQSMDTVAVFVTQPSVATIADPTLCDVTDVQLSGNPGSAGTWAQVSGPNTPTINPNTANTAIISGLITGVYQFSYTIPAVGLCPQTSSTVSFENFPGTSTANAGPDQNICITSPGTVTTTVMAATGTGSWQQLSGPTTVSFTNSTSPTTTVGNLQQGIYSLRWNVVNGGCSVNGDVVVLYINREPSNAVAGPNQLNACAGTINMAATAPTVGIGTWTQISGPNTATINTPVSPTTAISNTIVGTYVFRWTVTNGTACTPKTADVTIDVTTGAPTTSNAGISQNICNSPGPTVSLVLAGNTPVVGTGLWSVVSGPGTPTFIDPSLSNAQIDGLIAGSYILRWRITSGSCFSDDTMMVNVTASPTVSNAGTPQNVCLYSPVTMAANTPTTGTGAWSVVSVPSGAPAPVFINTALPNTQVTGLVAGNYVFRWTISNGLCPASISDVSITVNPAPTPAIAGAFQTGCAGQATTLNGNNPSSGTGTWSAVSGPNTPVFTNANLYNTTVTGLVAGTYVVKWTIATGGGTCTSSDNTQITVQSALAANTVSAPQTICFNTAPATLTGSTPTGGSGTYTYQWQFSTTSSTAGFTNVGGNSINHSPTAISATRWYRRYVTSGGCSVADTSAAIQITVLPVLAGNTITPPTPSTFCGGGDPGTIVGSTPTGGNGSYTYQWQSSTTSSTTGFTDIGGATGIDYDPPAISVTTWYRRVVTTFTCATNTSTALQMTVSPIPVLTSALTSSTCSNVSHTYTPTSSLGGTTYAWSRAVVAGITNPAGSGTGAATETLVNITNAPVNVVYAYSLTAGGCTNPTNFYVTVTVQPTPTVIVPSNQSVCNGAATAPWSFTGGVSGTVYNWTNSNTSIGLLASGTGDIASFNAINTGTAPVTATITVTPTFAGCNGTPVAFTVTVNPTPQLTSGTTGTVCSGSSYTYTPTSSTTGATFSWTRSSVAGISNPAGSGNGSISETLINTTGAPVSVTYIYTVSANGCNNTTNLVVTVNPMPTLTSSLIPSNICDNSLFSYTPTSNIGAGVTFSWSRAAVAGIANVAATGTGNPNETLDNTTIAPVTVTYVYTLSTVACTNPTTYNITVVVNPTPALTSTLTPPAICNGTTFAYTATSNVIASTFSWTRAAIASINGNVGGSGTGANIGEVLTNSSVAPVNVTYTITTTINGCSSVENVVVSVNPTPLLTSAGSIADICSGSVANYTPTSSTVGTVFDWTRAAVTGISSLASAGTGNPGETLVNTTNAPITVTYVYSLSINGCVSSVPYNVTVVVKPTPILSSPQNAGAVCTGTPFTYTATSTTTGTTFAWSRAAVAGISNAAATGTGNVNETLINTTSAPVNVTYVYTPTANGCTGIPYNVVVTVNPPATLSSTLTPPAICNGTTFAYTATSATPGVIYSWSRAAIPTINGNTPGSGTGAAITEILTNSSTAPVNVTYAVTTSSNGCIGVQNVVVSVNPTPVLTSPGTIADICSGSVANYTPTSSTAGVVFDWSRAAVTGISSLAATGTADPNETLVNTTAAPITVTYVYSLSINGCVSSIPYNVTVVVKPTPILSSPQTAGPICSGTLLTYTPSSPTTGTTFAWSRATVAGISNAAATGTAGISETLINTTNAPIDVTYEYILTANGCVSIPYDVVVTVNPTPSLTNAGAAPAICSSNTFSFVPTSNVSGSTFDWTRAAVAGISNAAASGTGNPNEVLVNTTNAPVTVTYVYIVSANGCVSTPANVTVVVSPTPTLTSTLTPPAICNNTAFSYVPTGNIVGAAFSWSRATVSGISNVAATGTDNPNETLINTTASPVVVTYVYTVSANGCNSVPYNVTVTVNPTPTLSSTLTPANVCSNTIFSYAPTSNTSGTTFNWSRAAVAGISNGAATGAGNPNETLVNTTNAPIIVTYVYTLSANGCNNTQNVTVTVNPIPVLSTPLVATPICNGLLFAYTAASNVTGTAFSWTRSAMPSINGGAGGSGASNIISETLTNSTNSPVVVSYVFTMTSNGCNNTQTVTVVVNPTVTLTSTITPPAICDETIFSYVPTSNVTGATFSWSRAAVTGIANAAATGVGNPNETLDNTSGVPVTVTYQYMVTANGCNSGFYFVTVTVKPSPALTSTVSPPGICSGTNFSYTPTSNTTGTVFNWSRAAVTGISNTSASGLGNPNEVLVNFTSSPVNVTYVYSLSANGCTNPTLYNVVVTVSPSPILSSTLAPASICSGTMFNYTPTSSTPGATFAWSRAAVPGITNVAATGINDPAEILSNSTNAPINVTYLYTVSINSCSSAAYSVVVSVKPQPVLTSLTNPSAICNNTSFNYTPASNVTGTSFAWTRAAVAGISNPATSGINAVSEVLSNTTAAPITVTYVYTLSINGCVSAPTNVSVVVNPTPALTSTLTPPAICNNTTFNYTPTSSTTGAVFNWARAAVAGISNTASSGSGNPAEILVNTTAAPINVTYVYTLSANSCTNPVTYSVVVTVKPSPALTTSLTPAAICNNTAFSYVPTSSTIGATFAWSRAAIAGISNGAATGAGNPNETLTNTTNAPVIVTYVYTVAANGCTNTTTYNVMVTVNPTPLLTSPLVMPAICGGATFNYSPTSSTSGTTFSWSRAAVPGIANPASTGVGNPAEALINNTTTPVTVTYVYTVSANGCSNPTLYNITVVVNPVPLMTSTVSPPAICNNATFNYTPTSNTTGTTFTWSRAAVAGISNTAASGTGNPAEALTNTTPLPINVTYAYTLSANGCTNTNTYNVVVTVNPTPQLTSTLTPPAICHNNPFIYVPTSLTPGTTFAWSRAAVPGINSNTPGSGFGNPNEMLANSTSAPITVNYVYTLSANGCTNPTTYTVSVVVNPLPILTSTLSPADVCDSTVFNYIPTSPTVGTIFTWSRAAVAGIANLMATGTGNPAEMLINTTPVPVDVTYVYVLSINGCNNPITYNVVVTVNPTPLLSTPVHLPSQCNNLMFAYTPASPTPGTTFAWSRSAIPGLDNAPATGTNGISEVLVNNSPDSVYVVYEYTLTAFGCSHTQLIGLWVKPTPVLTSTLTPPAICNNTTFSYTPTSLTVATAFNWTRAANVNISNPAASGTGDPNEVLTNTGADTVHVTYTYLLSAYGCNNDTPYHVVVVVNPTPVLASTLTPAAICDSTVFNYTPTSLTPNTTFDWTRAAVAGIANTAAAGTGNPMETLDNTTPDPITVTYVYTLTANGCTNPTTYSVDVVVNPTPYLNTTLTPPAICNNTVFNYTPGSNTVGTTFDWSRAAVAGISNAAATGTDDPNETLENTTTAPIDVVYEYTMTANGCSHIQFVTVTVYPSVTVADAGVDLGPLNATAAILNANQPVVGSGNWSFVTGPNTPVIVDPALFNTEVNTLIPGTYTFVWTITSPWNCPGSTDTMKVIINVPPVAVDDSATTNVNIAVVIDVTDNDTDADGTIDDATVTIITYPSHGTLSTPSVTGNVLYTPDNNFIGLDNFTYTVKDNDNGVSNIANVVIAVYERPNAIDDDTMTMTNIAVDINVLDNDIAGSGPIDPTTVTVVTDVTNGITMVDPNTGVVTYIPANGYYGTDHFTYFVKDVLNSLSDTANVTIRVYKAPVAVDDTATTTEDIPVLIDIVANDSAFGIDLNLGSVAIVSNPTNGTVQNNNNGTVLYTPNDGYYGTDVFTYIVTDNNGFVSNVAKVTVTIVQNTPDLLLVKTIATPISQIEVGKTVEFNIMLTNIGKEVATELVVTDILADNLGGKNVRLEVTNGSAVYDEVTKTITWNMSSLPVGESYMMKVFVQVTSGGDISNTATAKCRESESIISNNASTAFANMTDKEDLFIPNVITVNGDGKNDYFQVLGLEKYPNAKFMVFNRWGSMVYESSDYKNTWDGADLNEGTYYYILEVNKFGTIRKYSGWVQVLR